MSTLREIYNASFGEEANQQKEASAGAMAAPLAAKTPGALRKLISAAKKALESAGQKGGRAVSRTGFKAHAKGHKRTGKAIAEAGRVLEKHPKKTIGIAAAGGAGAAGYAGAKALKKKSSEEAASLRDIYEANFGKEAAENKEATVEKLSDEEITEALNNMSEEQVYDLANEMGITQDEVNSAASEIAEAQASESDEGEKTSSDEVEKTAEELYFGGRIFGQGFLQQLSESGDEGVEKQASQEKIAEADVIRALLAHKASQEQ